MRTKPVFEVWTKYELVNLLNFMADNEPKITDLTEEYLKERNNKRDKEK